MAMPRLRPLELVSRSVGREWALLPPNVSFRTELKALYAAMLRTFCLSAAALRAAARWDAPAARPQPSIKTPPAPVFKTDAIPLRTAPPRRTAARKNRQRNTLAGGACVVGGAAVIAWLMANHPPQPASPPLAAAPDVTLNTPAKPADGTDRGEHERSRSGRIERAPDAPLLWNPARGVPTPGKQNAAITAGAQTQPSTSSRVEPNASAAAAHEAPVHGTQRAHADDTRAIAVKPRAAHAYANDNVASNTANRAAADHPAHDSDKLGSTKRERDAIASTDARRTPHVTARVSSGIAPRHGLHGSTGATSAAHDTRLTSNHRARHLPSIAGAYSPLAPSSRANSDYDSVTLSAGTHVRDLAPAEIRHGRVDTDSTEWMNHLSQRRVTEIPDRFSK
jgi:hypothetical protein